MVVDSSLAIQKLIEFSLGKEGFEVTSFSDGLSALDAVDQVQPFLIVADYNLPGINIQRFCDKLKKRPNSHERPILVMINSAEPADREKLKQSGVTDFIKKPVESTDLLEKIKAFSKGADDSAEPTAAMFKQEPAQTSKEKDEMMKIEELLGWSVPQDQPFAQSQAAAEKTGSSMGEKTGRGPADDDVILVEEEETTESPVISSDLREPIKQTLPEPEPAPAAEVPVIPPPPKAEVLPLVRASGEAATREVVEQVAWDTVPGLAESAVQKITEQLMQTVVNKLAKEIVEKVAWEIIPDMAEIVIQKEIEKLKAENN